MSNKICWTEPFVVDEMNKFYEASIRDFQYFKHLFILVDLISNSKGHNGDMLDIGCGTAFLSELCYSSKYTGADYPHIIEGCAKRNYPNGDFHYIDFVNDDITWIGEYDLVCTNGFIDIMERPLDALNKLLSNSRGDVIIHRQEISGGPTRVVTNPSYGGMTYHSIINRGDFMATISKYGYRIKKEVNLYFQWENGGNSFLLTKIS